MCMTVRVCACARACVCVRACVRVCVGGEAEGGREKESTQRSSCYVQEKHWCVILTPDLDVTVFKLWKSKHEAC